MVKTVSAQSFGARKAAKHPETSSPGTPVSASPAIMSTGKNGWANSKSKEGKVLATAARKAAWELLQSDYVTKDASLHAAGLQAHAD
jgi:hypothetical protein